MSAVACVPAARPAPAVPRLASLNEGKPPSARVEHVATEPFGEGGDLWVRHYRLGNGLDLIYLRDEAAPVFSYHTWLRVGSRDEREGKTGLAHLFEHLMFNETDSLARGQFDRILEAAGAQSNAGTWVDWTFYYEDLPASEIDLVVRLEADRLGHLVLREPQVTSEREVVANERRFRVDDDVSGEMNEMMWATSFTVHPYHWPTIGWMRDIEAFTPQDCEDFYRRFYAPNRVTLVVVGDVDERRLLRLVQSHYGAMARQPEETTRATPEPPQLLERRQEIRRPVSSDKLQIGWRGPALTDRDHAPLSVLSEILFGGRSSRLFRRLVVEGEIAREARGWVSTFRDPGLYEVSVDLREGRTAEEALAIVDEEAARIRRQAPSGSELEKARNRIELGLLQSLQTTGGKAEQLGFWQVTAGDFRGVFRRLEETRAVTADDVRRVARRYLRRRARTIVIARPAPAAEPAAEAAAGEDAS